MNTPMPVATRQPLDTAILPLHSSNAWLRLSIGTALLASVGSVIAVSVDEFYSGLTGAFLPQALAQDIANIAVVAPVMVVSAVLAMRGSLAAHLIWLGVMAYTVYNYVIYTFSIPFGPLFPLWVAVLGLSLFALIGGVVSTESVAVRARFVNDRAVATAAWVLLVTAGVFALLWLVEDLPALFTGTAQQSAVDLELPTNPVHILDYAFFLPAAIVTGIQLLKGRAFGFVVVPALLVFLILTCIPIVITPIVQASLGVDAGWSVLGPVGALGLLMTASLVWLLGTAVRVTRSAH